MTTATFTRAGGRVTVTISGHAGYNPGGPDIVCAACSALACTLAACLEAEGIEPFHVEAGEVAIDVSPGKDVLGRVEAIIKVIETGFALLADKYPGYVRLRERSGEK